MKHKISLDDTDKTLGLIVCGLVALVLTIALLLHFFLGVEWAVELGLMAIGWWFGATMTWLIGKHHRLFKEKNVQ